MALLFHVVLALIVASSIAIDVANLQHGRRSSSSSHSYNRRPCCSPDIAFLIDITDGVGFSRHGSQYIRDFMSKIIYKTSRKECDHVRAALVEYGAQARIRCDFKKHPSVHSLKEAIARYTPGSSLGAASNAKAAFSGARLLFTNPERGHRSSSHLTIFWLVNSTPNDMPALQAVVSELKGYGTVQIVVVAVGGNVDAASVGQIATGRDYFFRINSADQLRKLAKHSIKVSYCPSAPRTQPPPTQAPNPTNPPTRRTPGPNPTNPPTRRTTLPEPIPADDYCHQCRMRRNQKDLYLDATECHHYYQCFYLNETTAYGIRRVCPVGTFWREAVMTCMPEGDTPCVDRCMDDTVAAKGCYAGKGCRQYFVCANTASYGMCCPDGTQFNEAKCECEESATCSDTCTQKGPAVPTTAKPSSKFNATICKDSWDNYIMQAPGETNAFITLDLEGQALPENKLFCPAGTRFDLDTCSCSIYDESALPNPSAPSRKALIWLNFNADMRDYSVNKFVPFVYGQAERDASVYAYGGGSLSVDQGYLEIPGLKSYDMRNAGSWCIHFRCEYGNGYNCGASGGIVSNNKDTSTTEYTAILATQASNSFTGRFLFWRPVGPKAVNSAISTPANGWNHVCVTFNGNTLKLYLNGALADSEDMGGYLAIAHCPYVLGHDQGFGYFKGHLDDFLMTDFAMTEQEIKAHGTGDYAYLANAGFW